MDVLTKEQRRFNMSRIRGTNTKPELLLRRYLWRYGARYRIRTKLPGKPDIVFVRQKMAVFIDGCFWHGCPEHRVMPKSNERFWKTKLEANVARDIKNTKLLKEKGWTVVRVWEHDVKKSLETVGNHILKKLKLQ
jgi:DNA mismatch endonuclease, patch repair protein